MASVINMEAAVSVGSGIISVEMASAADAGGDKVVCENNLFLTFLTFSFSIEHEEDLASYLILAALLSHFSTLTLLELSTLFSSLTLKHRDINE